MVYVGIDVAKDKHDCFIVNSDGEVLHDVFTIQNNMAEAREALSSKKSFMGALNFLNSQAAVSLMRTRADKFEIVV